MALWHPRHLRGGTMVAVLDTTADGDVLISVHVQPGGSRDEVVGRHGDALKVKVSAPAAQDGRMRTVGVDLSANPAKTAVCAIDWDTFDVTLLPRPVTDEHIVEAIAGADRAGIDVPLGWPDSFIDAITAHHAGEPWPVAELAPPTDREPLRFRLSDRVLQANGSRPLSVSTDRIGVAAMRWARLEHLLREAGVEVDRSGVTGRVCETYPAASLRHWGLTNVGYKTRSNDGVRRALLKALADRCGKRGPAVHDLLVDRDDDDLDAFVCALVAHEVAAGRSTGPGDDQVATARREGWIHLPVEDLEVVIGVP